MMQLEHSITCWYLLVSDTFRHLPVTGSPWLKVSS